MGRRAQAVAVSLGLAALVAAGPASAALAPIYESIREIGGILDDPRLTQAIGAGALPIVSITDNGEGGYAFATERCTVAVKVVTVPPDPGKPVTAGPRQFTLDFQQPVCK